MQVSLSFSVLLHKASDKVETMEVYGWNDKVAKISYYVGRNCEKISCSKFQKQYLKEERSLRIGKGMFGNKGLSTYGVKVDMFRYAVLVGRLSSHTFVSRERWDYIRIDYVSISDHAFFTFQSPIHYYDDEAAVLDLREKYKDRKCSQWSNSHTMEEWHLSFCDDVLTVLLLVLVSGYVRM
ncbi:hypothetical protein Tco_0953527 [Tanacetum coccineum]|uniref:Uncharacterized protein n=1 Tax=Tanacetum coccineum TaxID=301880 RepID=A0ABQ5E0V9_9ASTR